MGLLIRTMIVRVTTAWSTMCCTYGLRF